MKPSAIIAEWEKGCGNTILSGKPEDCPDCTRIMIKALKVALEADDALTDREKDLMMAIYTVVAASGGKVRVPKAVARAYTPGVSILDSRVCPITGAMIFEVKR